MAFYECVSSGRTLSSTLLWSNPSPTSNFAVQNITLSESITNFDYIRIVARFSTSDATQTWAMYKTSDILAWGDGNSSSVAKPHGALNGRQSSWALRNISYRDSTIRFGSASLGASENNAYMIPIAIYGLKYVTSNPSAGFLPENSYLHCTLDTFSGLTAYTDGVENSFRTSTTYNWYDIINTNGKNTITIGTAGANKSPVKIFGYNGQSETTVYNGYATADSYNVSTYDCIIIAYSRGSSSAFTLKWTIT